MTVLSLYKKSWHIWTEGSVDGTQQGRVIDPKEMPVELMDIIQNGRKVYIWDLSYFKDDVFRLVHHMGYTFVDGNPKIKEMKSHTCKYLISHLGDCYKITLKTTHKTSCVIMDAKKIVPLYNLEDVMKSFGDSVNPNMSAAVYNAIREITREHDGCTISGIARRSWSTVTRHEIKELVIDMNNYDILLDDGSIVTGDEYIRPAYHGGFCYKKDGIIRDYGPGICLDANSLYPYEMKKPMPIGYPVYKAGKPTKADIFNVRIGQGFVYMRIILEATLKKDHIPCITASGSSHEMSYRGETWISTTYHDGWKLENGVKKPIRFPLLLTITWQEWELIQEQYNIEHVKYIDFLYFKTSSCIFASYIDKWYSEKQKNDANKGRRKVAKMMENGLSGSFARNKTCENFFVTYDDELDRPIYHLAKSETLNKSYIHIGAAITALARVDIIRKAQQHYDRWLYTDTDSIFLKGYDVPDDFEISNKLGDWKIDKQYKRIEFLKAKTYVYVDTDDRLQLTIAGVSGPGKELMLKYLNCEISILPRYWKECCLMQKDRMKMSSENYKEFLKHNAYLKKFINSDHSDPLEEVRTWACPTLIREHDDMFSQNYFMQWNMVADMNEYVKYY